MRRMAFQISFKFRVHVYRSRALKVTLATEVAVKGEHGDFIKKTAVHWESASDFAFQIDCVRYEKIFGRLGCWKDAAPRNMVNQPTQISPRHSPIWLSSIEFPVGTSSARARWTCQKFAIEASWIGTHTELMLKLNKNRFKANGKPIISKLWTITSKRWALGEVSANL